MLNDASALIESGDLGDELANGNPEKAIGILTMMGAMVNDPALDELDSKVIYASLVSSSTVPHTLISNEMIHVS